MRDQPQGEGAAGGNSQGGVRDGGEEVLECVCMCECLDVREDFEAGGVEEVDGGVLFLWVWVWVWVCLYVCVRMSE